MKNKIIAFIFLLAMTVPALSVAQLKTSKSMVFKPSDSGQKPKGFLNYLLNPSKFSMSHSYSVFYTSIGKQSFSQGLYLNTMNYRFSDPLMMQVRIGYVHQPFGGLGRTTGKNGALFVQRAMLQYKPSENMSFTIDYQVLPSSMVSPYYYNW